MVDTDTGTLRSVTVIRPVVLSGGSGTRLWPLSTPEYPKQFADLLDGASLFQLTLQRLAGHSGVEDPIVVSGAGHLSKVASVAQHAGVSLQSVLAEPEGRNTAPACVAAASVVDGEDVLVILPSDHLIRDVESFGAAVTSAAQQAMAGYVVTFGITPGDPNTGYGYIEMGENLGDVFTVERFKEKPDLSEAEGMVTDGRHVWNSGMFVVSASVLVEEARAYCPEIVDAVTRSLREPVDGVISLGDEFREATKISLDHAIMEKTSKAVVLPIEVGWDDVGSFEALWSVADKDSSGNAVAGDVVLVDVDGSYVTAASRTVAVAGLSGVVVVETEDAVLVVAKDRSQLVRDVVDLLESD